MNLLFSLYCTCASALTKRPASTLRRHCPNCWTCLPGWGDRPWQPAARANFLAWLTESALSIGSTSQFGAPVHIHRIRILIGYWLCYDILWICWDTYHWEESPVGEVPCREEIEGAIREIQLLPPDPSQSLSEDLHRNIRCYVEPIPTLEPDMGCSCEMEVRVI